MRRETHMPIQHMPGPAYTRIRSVQIPPLKSRQVTCHAANYHSLASSVRYEQTPKAATVSAPMFLPPIHQSGNKNLVIIYPFYLPHRTYEFTTSAIAILSPYQGCSVPKNAFPLLTKHYPISPACSHFPHSSFRRFPGTLSGFPQRLS